MTDSDWVTVWDSLFFKGLYLNKLNDKRIAFAISDYVWSSGNIAILHAKKTYNLLYPSQPVSPVPFIDSLFISKLNNIQNKQLYLTVYNNFRRTHYLSANPIYVNGLLKRLDYFEKFLKRI